MDEYIPYMTIAGDSFDSVALDFFDDEKYATDIIRLNPEYAGTLVFAADVELKIPVFIPSTSSTLPPWME